MFEMVETPKLGVNPCCTPAESVAISQILVIEMLLLFATVGPLLPVLIDRPVLAARVKVGDK